MRIKIEVRVNWGLVLGVGFTCLALGIIVLLGAALPPLQASPRGLSRLSAGPDLVIQSIKLTPPFPAPGQPVDIEIKITNQGNANAGGFTTYLYVDPRGEPQLDTPDTSLTFLFGLNAGLSFVWTYRNYTFDTQGCDHSIYAWVDRDNTVPEDNESNNLSSIGVCVGTTPTPSSTASPSSTPMPSPTRTPTPTLTPAPCQADSYEPDGSCALARTITTDGVHQMHSLCPVGDTDWVKFTVQAGITYTIATVNVGADGDTVLSLYNQCDVSPLAISDPFFGNGAQLLWPASSDGVYYLKIEHHAATYGPSTGYELFVSASTSCQGDDYEMDDSCAVARDISVGGAAQHHLFCKPQDQDWVKWTAVAGATYLISATGVGPDADPILSLYNQCAFGAPLVHGQQIEWTAPAAGIYYAAVQNHNPSTFGPSTAYDLAVHMTQCAPDSFEGDNSPGAARQAQSTGAEQVRSFCPAGDRDWISFQATQGQLYVMETYELGADGDTILCLFGADGTTQIACNDDGGGGLASRLRWTAAAAGNYYLRVQNQPDAVSGPTTAYHLAITQGEPVDPLEPDNTAAQAKPIPTDGTLQRHNFTPAGDEDWVRFDAVAGEPYVIQTTNLAGDCDTTLHLLDTDGVTELARNDDYGAGTRSLITYIFSHAGTYYARVHHYRSNRSGHGTAYDLSVSRGAQPPTATPTATPPPTPGPTPTPSASGVKTLIVTNHERLEALYGAPATTNVMNRLALLAGDSRVRGLILQAEANTSAANAYTLWNTNPISTTLANNVTSAVRNLIRSALDTNPGVEYIVLVGNDRVVPFRRIPDRTSHPESNYQAFVTGGTTIWAACRDSMTLTDDYYADREPSVVNGQEIYVPDFALGRLPEGPDEIVAFINTYLASGQLNMHNVLVTGYDFVIDAGQSVAANITSDLGPNGTVNASLMGDWWTASALRDLQLNTSPRFDVQFINGHATHHLEGAPQGGGVSDGEIWNAASADLNQALVVTLGCHSGLNDVGGLPAGLDLAQAFFKRGANYIANTGYGWGSNAGLGWSERLMANYVTALTHGSSVYIGKAVMAAKQRYFNETPAFDSYDEKALMESTLYGLPMYQLSSGGILGEENPFPSVQITTTFALASGPVRTGFLNFNLAGSFSALDEHQTTDGTYFGINQITQVAAGQPVQPQFFANVTAPIAGRAHGAIMTTGRYTETATVDPLIARPVNEWVPREEWTEPVLDHDGWLPTRPVALQNLSSGASFTDTLLTQLGQYNGQTQHERLYDSMSIELYYSSSSDWTGPQITYVGERIDLARQIAAVKVEAIDPSGVLGGKVTYTRGNGQWQSIDLQYDAARMKWVTEIPAQPGLLYFVQMLDTAGNVTVSDNKGRYYNVEVSQAYLPFATKGR
ncbi:MAG: hypothetical protein EXR62_06130 [Chloroflexi bacterium]|nr:hypothetical protein [Chloroflexota bacterium]